MSANTTPSFLRGCAAAGRVSRFRARVPFFFCQKKDTKENHLNLRFKDPLARRGVYEFGSMYSRMKYAGYHCRSKGLCLRSPARRLARPLASATVGAIFFYRMGDYQIAPKPPGGRLWLVAANAAGEFKTPPAGETGDPSSVSFADTCLPAGRSVRGSDRPPACHSTPRPPGGRLTGVIYARRRGGGCRRRRGWCRCTRSRRVPGSGAWGGYPRGCPPADGDTASTPRPRPRPARRYGYRRCPGGGGCRMASRHPATRRR